MTLSQSPPGRPPAEGVGTCAPPKPGFPHSPRPPFHMPCPLPRWTEPVHLSVSSRLVRPSPRHRRVGIHKFTFGPGQTSRVLRPAGLLGDPRWPLSQGFSSVRYRASRISATRPTDSYLGGTLTHW